MQLTPGLGESPFKNISVQVRNTFGGLAGVIEDCGVDCIVLAVVESFTLSPEILSSKRTRVSKSYTDTIDNIVLDLLESPKFANTSKNIFIEGTKGIKKIVSPNKTPYGLISDLGANSISSVNNSPNYVFFENTKGIHFRTLESLYSQPSIGNFMLSDSADVDFSEGGVMNVKEELGAIKSYQISGNNNTMLNIESGMLASKTIEYDIFQIAKHINLINCP